MGTRVHYALLEHSLVLHSTDSNEQTQRNEVEARVDNFMQDTVKKHFDHPSLGLVPLFIGMKERSIITTVETITSQKNQYMT